MNNINIEPIYKLLINDSKITDETLKAYGYKEEDVYLLLENNIIEKLKNGEYKLVVVDKFRKYGITLLKAGKTYLANKCFTKCYELAPNGKNIILQYMLSLLRWKQYQEIFEVIAKVEPTVDDANYNLYLYLLSYFTDVPDEYKEKIRALSEFDLLMPVSSGNRTENNIRRSIINSKFKFAYKQTNKILSKNKDYLVKFEFIRELLKNVISAENKYKDTLIELVKKGKYKDLVLILKERYNIRYLSRVDSCILITVENLIEILENWKIPVPTIEDTDDIYQALRGKNFKLALELDEKFIAENNIAENTNILNLLLVELNKLITKIEFETNINKEYLALEGNKDINDAMEMAYYIKMEAMSLEEATKRLGLKKELVLLIKLIYARDYYIEGKILEGDLLVKEVEDSLDKSYEVLSFIEKVKSYRDSDNKDGVLKRKLNRITKQG